MAGLCVATVALLGVVAVSGFYGWKVADNLLLAVVLSVAGFVTGLLAYKNLKRRNRAAVRAERHTIQVKQASEPKS